MRARNPGSSSTGSTIPSNVRRGSAFDTTVLARTLLARRQRSLPRHGHSGHRCGSTSASVRMVTPAARAADASAVVNAPRPPRTNLGTPPPVAICIRRTAVLPADRGPSAVPKMPRAASTARSGSDSNHSETKSAADIGAHRNNRYASFFPSPRSRRAIRQQCPEVAARRMFDLGRSARQY